MKKTLVLIDRDGVLVYDKKYYLGSQRDWKKKVRILPGVVKGLKLLNSIPDVSIYMITNQSGVAIKDFPLLTVKRAKEVCQYIINLIRKKGGRLDDYFICPHVSPDYVKRKNEFKFDKKRVCNCVCIKPRLGMVFDALRKEGLTAKKVNLFVVGDRASDVQTALNVKGTGILVPFVNEPGQISKVKKLKGKKYVAKDFLKAAEYIVRNAR